MLEPGWLNRQFQKTAEYVKRWPEWMRKEAGLITRRVPPVQPPSHDDRKQEPRPNNGNLHV